MIKPHTIGLFGTCGGSKWREPFIEKYTQQGIKFFNPQVPDWTPEFAKEEAKHLISDEIILFPVTGETYGSGSLAETGFSIFQALKPNKQRFVIIYIDPNLEESLKDNPVAYKESTRARALVMAHLQEANDPRVFLVDSLEQMLEVSLWLNGALINIHCARARCLA